MYNKDTIIAQATPPGFGSVGILRISGERAAHVACAILGKLPQARFASYLSFNDIDCTVIDKGIAIWFPAPHSFTGEDVLELQGHGGPIILDMLLKRILALNYVRIARPGEFSERAFINNKIDLTQAEAIADLIHANSEQAARLAINSLQGMFSLKINNLLNSILNLRVKIEASIDFPDENNEFISDKEIQDQLDIDITNLNNILKQACQGNVIREGMKLVIAGKPNSGKSSIFNALLGMESAIVTDIAGTTRDILKEYIHIDGMPIHIIDTAGLREEATNKVEDIGIKRACEEIKQSNHVLLVVDGSIYKDKDINLIISDFKTYLPSSLPITVIRNKIDITGEPCGFKKINNYVRVCLSAFTGEGIDMLRIHLKNYMGLSNNTEGIFLARRRHLHSLELTSFFLEKTKKYLINNPCRELLAEELRNAHLTLSKVTGQYSTENLLENIFSSFCIGK
ncbi:tRNA uridine-5-carboxymethylaminomethyl(34) synthesis GTPase MnmE [Pantoea sp. Mhis]|uniref:tRNA uridine-5-carboxymethylaminomethyl(34) synthesis GTPase MnmE n=1 Tax=Pantoea sp. Mhis TaxID=2576759 RepID=UPI00135C7EBE|nr:tRNA uridine-5-carboxymethylaminomethyl(34) synthesis GTPase MnmE [Pantoea sp. Mhis]MXP56740.1 tRNA uridine-5-carboxymethylaminomethyl(34) synthesis GTPase MnmE [Pantoea sp. Mhis]